MNYVAFIWTDGLPVPEALGVMQRELPAWIEEMDGRGVRLLGRELDLPETAATVRAHRGETLVTDGPFAEAKEFIAGFDLLECADLDEAIDVMAKSPVCRFHPIEIRPLRGGLRLGAGAPAFRRDDDSAGIPYLLTVLAGEAPPATADERGMAQEYETWRQQLEARGVFILGGALEGPETATSVRARNGETVLSDGPSFGTEEFIAHIDVVSCADRQQAIDLAIAHPLARHHALEVRPFYSE
jgi:hypothetical protein